MLVLRCVSRLTPCVAVDRLSRPWDCVSCFTACVVIDCMTVMHGVPQVVASGIDRAVKALLTSPDAVVQSISCRVAARALLNMCVEDDAPVVDDDLSLDVRFDGDGVASSALTAVDGDDVIVEPDSGHDHDAEVSVAVADGSSAAVLPVVPPTVPTISGAGTTPSTGVVSTSAPVAPSSLPAIISGGGAVAASTGGVIAVPPPTAPLMGGAGAAVPVAVAVAVAPPPLPRPAPPPSTTPAVHSVGIANGRPGVWSGVCSALGSLSSLSSLSLSRSLSALCYAPCCVLQRNTVIFPYIHIWCCSACVVVTSRRCHRCDCVCGAAHFWYSPGVPKHTGSLSLSVHRDGSVTGSGSDGRGHFVLRGVVRERRSVYIAKTYSLEGSSALDRIARLVGRTSVSLSLVVQWVVSIVG
jgi:hypothetical protein